MAQKVDTLQHQIQQTERRLEDVERGIQEKEEKLKFLRKEREKVLKRIEHCDQAIERYRDRRKVYDDKISMNVLKQESLNNEIEQCNKSLAEQKDLLALRLRSWYKAGSLSLWRIILGSDSFLDLSRKMYSLKLIACEDNRLIREMLRQRKKIQESREQVRLHQCEIERIREEAAGQEAEWIRKREEKAVHLRSLQGEGNRYRLVSKKLSHDLVEIKELLEKLKKEQIRNQRPYQLSDFSLRKGKLPWPVGGVSKSSFGKKAGNISKDPLSTSKGITIKVPLGEKIYAIHDGKALYTDRCMGYGKLLIIDHGKGYCSIYAHVSEFLVKSQDTVKEGQVIALGGDTGVVSEPQLYFEIRYQGLPLEPLNWLR
ncbi:MAG: murein hydrolase activator EnvC family protein [bacterium]